MADVTVNITRANIYHIAEGISVTIAQHNGGTPSFEQLWASPSEAQKLDIYYREAVGDLERRLMEWIKDASSQFDLTADGNDYTLRVSPSTFWPSRLEGLLKNKIQDFIVHSVTAGWLNDFEGLSVKMDYQAMAASDLSDIRIILYQRDFNFAESARSSDSTTKDTPSASSAGARGSDSETKDTPSSQSADARGSDSETKETPTTQSADARGTDTDKETSLRRVEAGYRRRDDVVKSGSDDLPFLLQPNMQRHRDNVPVVKHTDYTDMSGTDYGRYGSHHCIGYPRPQTRPLRECDNSPAPPVPPAPELEPRIYPQPPSHILLPHDPNLPEPKEPLFHADGIDWDDADRYNIEKEREFISSHNCGEPGCDMRKGDSMDWGI